MSGLVAAGEIGFGSGMRSSLDSLPGIPGVDRGLGSVVGVLCSGIWRWTATADGTEKASGCVIDGSFGFCAGLGLAEMLTASAA